MKFFHVADLHFGKMLYNVQMVENDQPAWVEEFLKAVDRYQPEAVVMSGDIYDRRIPSPEAMKLFGHLLTELARRDKYVFVIPGNHDSDIRLSHVNELLSSRRIYIAGELEKELMHISVPDGDKEVNFWLMPFVFPKLVSDPRVLNDPEISTYDEAARALLATQKLDPEACNILLAHQNVLANGVAADHSASESIVGGLGEIDFSAFDRFDYVALGHIHNEQPVGRETVRYAGCPLYYDFSELGRCKDLTLVTVNGKNDISIEKVPIPLLHTLKQVSGSLEEILEQGETIPDKNRYYIQAVLRDRHVPPRAMEQLQAMFGRSLVNVKREYLPTEEETALGIKHAEAAGLSIDAQFAGFYQETQGELLDADQEELILKILEQQLRRGDVFAANAKTVPADDTEELIEMLLGRTEESHETA